MSAIFTVDELLSLKKSSLNHLAEYYEIDPSGLSRQEIVEKLMSVLVKEEQTEESPAMSPRVRRAMESVKNG